MSRLTYRLVLATDIAGYSRRNTAQQQWAQAELCHVLGSAAADAGFDRDRWHRQDRGDGELAVLPEGIDVTKVVGEFTGAMASALAALNTGRSTHRLLRVRLALHHGTLTDGSLGPAGDAPIVASRLVDAEAGREYLRAHPDHHLTVIVSASLYHDVISTGFCSMNPADFEPIQAVVKEIQYDGYLYCGRRVSAHREPHPARYGRRIRTGTRFAWDAALKHRETTPDQP